MLKSLLIGTNGSEWSQSAVALGLDWARSLGIPVTLLGVVDVEGLTQGESVPIGAARFKAEKDASVFANAAERIAGALDEATAAATAAGVRHETRIVHGTPEEALGDEVQRHDLMIVGRRALPRSNHDPAASTTLAAILRKASRPVVVAIGEPAHSGPVVAAFDGSRECARALSSFVASGLFADQPIEILDVGEDTEAMENTAARARDFLVTHGRRVEIHLVQSSGKVGETVNEFVRTRGARLLVMGAFGDRRLKEILFGSVTRTVLSSAPAAMFLDH